MSETLVLLYHRQARVFLGEYEHAIDDKGRLAVPARFRDQLSEGVIVTRGFDNCLIGFPREFWDRLAQRVSALPFGQAGARDLQRRLFSAAADVPLDRQGRILIPQNLRDFGGLGEQVVISGMNEYFEIWSAERWQETLTRMDSDPDSFATQLSQLGI
jgi:MraZ protein